MSEQRFATPRPVELNVRLALGEIEIAATDGGESTVRIEGAPKLVDAITTELVGDRLTISQQRRGLTGRFGWRDGPLRVQIEVPDASRVSIMTAAGNTRLSSNVASLDVKSASGDVLASGEIDGDATVKTVSGETRLAGVTGDLTVKSVSGDVRADSVGGSVSTSSVSGAVRIGALRDGEVTVQTVSGDVELGIASGTCIDLDAASASGHLSSEIPLSDRPGAEPGPTLVIRGNTVSGDIRLLRAA